MIDFLENPTIKITTKFKDNTSYETLFDYIGVFEDNLDSCPEIQHLVPCILSNINFCLFPDNKQTLINVEFIEFEFKTKEFIATYKNINFNKLIITFDLDFVESYYQILLNDDDLFDTKGSCHIDFILNKNAMDI